MDRTRGISAVVSGPPSALQIHLRRSAAGAGHVEGVVRAAQVEARRTKAGRGGAATSLETLAPKPVILTTTAAEESGQRTTIAAGRGTARDAGQESELTEQRSAPARGTGAAGSTELVKAEKTLLAAAGNTHQLERVAAQLRYEAQGTTFVPSYMKRSRSPSSTRAAVPLHGQQQQRRGRQQQHQERRWQEHQQQQHYGWREREQKLEESHKRHPNSMQKQEPFHEQHSVQQRQRSPWSRRGQDLHDDLLNLTPLSGHTICFDTIMEGTETGRQTFHRRRDEPNCCSCRSSCGTVSGTHEHAQGREQQKGEPSRSQYHNAQHVQNQEKGQSQQQQLHQHPSSHPIPTFSLQCDTENTRRLPGVQERDERQHQPQHRGDEQQQRRQEHRQLSPHCTLREAERLDVCQQQQSRGSEDVLQEHNKQQHPQQAQQSQRQQNHVQYVHSHARQQICADKCVKRESAFSCADATESTVVAAALDSDSRGGARNFNSRAQHVSQEELRVYPAISRSLTDRSSVVDIAARCRPASLNRASATENRSTSLARAAALTKSASGAHVTSSISIRRSATASLSTAAAAAPAAAASAAATGHDSCSTSAAATAAATSCSSDGAAQTSGPDGSAVGVAARGAAPRRKQLSGAQKRKRKRELMSKCRVEHASLLSFLATTVTSELILNDWYALESQLRDESAYFERLSSSAWSLPAAVAALSPLSVVSASSPRRATGPHSQDTGDAAASIADSSDNGEHCELRPRLHVRGGKVLNTATQSQPRKEQDDLQWQEGEKKRQFYQKPHSQDQQLNRRNDGIVREAQQHTSEAQEQDGAGQRLHWIVMPDSESWDAFNDRRMATAVIDGDHASGSMTSSRAASGSLNNSSGRCSACDVLPPECATGICSSREVNSGTETICRSAAAYVEPDSRCRAGSARTGGIHALFNGGSNTSSGSSTNTSGDRRRPASGSGVSTRNSCSTASKDASEPAENRGTAAFAVVPTGGINGADEMKNTAAAAGAERRHPTPSDFLEGDERRQELELRLLGKTLHAERNCSKQNGSRSTDSDEMCYNRSSICSVGSTTGMTEKNSAGSNHNRSVSNRHSISSKNVSEKERSSMSDGKRCSGCSSSSSDSTNCGGSSEWSREVKVGDRSLFQQLYKGIQTNVVLNAGADRRTAGPRSPLHNPLPTDCRGGEKAETLLEFANETALERCLGEQELDCAAAPQFVPPDSVEFSETATQVDGTAACYSWRHNSLPSATDACAATLLAAGDKSPTDATSHQGSSLLRPEQRQGPQMPRTFWGTGGAARLAIEGRPVVCGKEMQPLVVCNSIANKDPDEEGEGGAEGGSHSTAKQSAAATVTEADETGRVRFTTLSCDGAEGATASCISECSSTGSNETTTIPKRRSSFDSSTTSHCTGCLRSSTPTSSTAHGARSPSHRLSSVEPDSAAGMLPIWKRNNAPPAVDDEASTASSSPVPALQQLPAPLLWLPPHCDGNKSSTLSPCSSFSDPESTTAASLSACVVPRRFAEDSQDQHLQQSQCHELHAQQDQLTHQRSLQLHAEQQTLLPVLPAQRQQPQKAVLQVERQQEIPQDVPARKRQEEHDTLSNGEPSGSHARGGTRQSSGQRQQRRVSAAEADDPLHDPALWPTQMTDALRISLVKRGPVQVVDFDFPRDSTQRRFGRQHYWRTAATGERYWRSWLVYSKSRDAVYCFCCKLYSQLAKSVVSTGFRRWKGAAEVLRSHEQSKDHRMCMLQWKCMCVKVGAEVAFGDLMQLWLPCGSSAASAASLGSYAAAAASAAGVAAPSSASVDAEDGERALKDRTENKVHAAVSVVETAHIPSKK